ncbi:hypothetical protein ACIBH1_42250 [Nonomuraea sp. NPDC050663]|uniref:hypothetical protein n=1 Tax=Nonomuraea sp. NPDC050663 TaxID=3364370 RepID=UPI0037882A57
MTAVAQTVDRTKFLRLALVVDAVVTGGNGLAYLTAAPLVSEFIGTDVTLLRGIGAFLTVYGVAVGFLGTRRTVHRAATQAVIGLNMAWTLASILAVVTGLLEFTTVGAVWAITQALTVAAFAELQIIGLRKTGVK